MYLEPVVLIADWLSGTLKDAGNVDRGVNAMLAGVPTIAGDAAPPNVVVEDEVRNASVARNRVTSSSPGVAVTIRKDIEITGVPPVSVSADANDVEICAIYCGRAAKTEEELRRGLYTGRAIVRSLRWFAKNDNVAQRALNDIQLIQLLNVRLVPTFEETADVVVTAAVIAKWKIRDQKPYG